jgi:exoribonuclease R
MAFSTFTASPARRFIDLLSHACLATLRINLPTSARRKPERSARAHNQSRVCEAAHTSSKLMPSIK